MNESSLVIGSWWKNKETGDIGFITDVQKRKGLIIFRFSQSGHVGSFDNMEFLREFEISPSDPKSVPESNINNRVTVGSIWRSVRGTEDCNKGRLIKVVHINGSLISWRFLANAEGCPKIKPLRNDIKTTCRSSFLYCFEKVQDNDNGAVYLPFDCVHDAKENPGKYQMVKVVDTSVSTTPGDFVYGTIKYTTAPVSSKEYFMPLENFHCEFELVSLNPAEEFCVDANDPNKVEDETIAPQQVTWNGAIWYHTIGGVHVAITIKEEKDVVWYVTSDNNAPGIYWQMPLEEWVKTYILYEGTVKPPCYPEGSFDKMIEETKERYEKVVEMLKEGEALRNKAGIHFGSIENEPIMDDSKETYLKTDESKMKEFDTGAKREDKSGKGRYDLIPGDIMADFVDYAWNTYFNEGPMTICDTDVSLSAYFDDMTDEELFFEFILNMTCLFFTKLEDLDETTDCVGERSYVVTWEDFHEALYEMREALAKHYEAGAKVHGVNNWKKGIPISDSERGGNFVDSMRRHTDQALRGLTDEPHPISAIWNAFAAVWTLRHKPHSAMYQNASDVKAEETSTNKDAEAEYLTLPSGKKIKIEFLHAITDNDKDNVFLTTLLCDKNAVDVVIKSLKNVNEAPDKIADAPTVSYSVLVANVNNCVELLSKMLVDNGSIDLKFETHEAYVNLYMICVLLKSVLSWFQDNDKGRVCIEHLISGIYDLINTNLPSVRRIFDNVKAEWVEGCDETVYAVCLGNPDKYRMLGMIDLCCRTGMKLMNDDHFCGRAISNGILFELKEHLGKLIKE